MADPTLLALLLVVPWVAAAAVALPWSRASYPRALALATMLLVLVIAIAAGLGFDEARGSGTSFIVDRPWLTTLGVRLHFAVDGYNVFLVLLAALLFPVALVFDGAEATGDRPLRIALLLALEGALLATFLAQDLLLFFVAWEAVLLPMVLLILVFGGADRRRAAFAFFLYTMAGSVLLLAAVLYLGAEAARQTGQWTFDLATLQGLALTRGQQDFVFAAVVLACLVKCPLFPFHAWLPAAYRAAPASGTALMAGLLSKMGAYGLVRLALPLAPDSALHWAPALMLLAAVSIVYGAVLALRQREYRLIIAYASLSHMGFVVLGVFSLQPAGLHGAWVQMLSHGLVVAGLFLLLGVLERRAGPAASAATGLAWHAPRFAVTLMLFVLASLALPLTSGFTAEFMVLLGAFDAGLAHWQAGTGSLALVATLLACTGVVLGATYMLLFARRLVFDRPDPPAAAPDLPWRETATLVPLLLLVLWLGVRPASWMQLTEPTVAALARPTSATTLEARHDD